jgi:NADPH:quinone reductase-like Zn-dependent oxidoreductase
MKAVVYHRYGPPSVLQLEDVPIPSIGDDDVLLRVHASSVNSWDWELLHGTPFANRVGALRSPKHPILGADVAGVVDEVGRKVKGVAPGDQVFGDLSHCGWGGFGEYVSVPATALAPKPPSLSFEEAAAVPQAGVLALQALRRGGSVGPGQEVLVNGAGGGVGTFAVQMAVAAGAVVTGIDAADKLDLVRSLGADDAMDHHRVELTRLEGRYDVVVDVAAHRSVFAYRRVLRRNGTYVFVGGATSRALQVIALGPAMSAFGHAKFRLLIHKPNRMDLVHITGLIESGTVRPVIDRCFPLERVPAALGYLGRGLVQGKVVIAVDPRAP